MMSNIAPDSPTLEPARAGRATEIRYSPITHGYHLYDAAGEMIGNIYGYESYLEAERADASRCLICKQPSGDPVCPECVESGHRCSANHVLEDDGSCGECEPDPLDLIAGDVGGVVAYVNGKRTIVVPGDY